MLITCKNVTFCIFVPTAHDDLSLPVTISSQAYAYYMQNVTFCVFVPTAHSALSLSLCLVGELRIQSAQNLTLPLLIIYLDGRLNNMMTL